MGRLFRRRKTIQPPSLLEENAEAMKRLPGLPGQIAREKPLLFVAIAALGYAGLQVLDRVLGLDRAREAQRIMQEEMRRPEW